MQLEEYQQYDALGLAELVRQKAVRADELLTIAIQLTEALDPEFNFMADKLYDYAQQNISRALPQNIFTGVPFLLKDLGMMLQGFPTRYGSRFGEDAPNAEINAHVVNRFLQAGFVIYGKTQTPEYGLSFVTEPQARGVCRNPWDPSKTPGGSSGGAAVAVATGCVPAAAANDGGGSIRVPAACCNLFGLKPTRGRISAAPLVGESWGGLATNHALTRTVRDSAAILDVIKGSVIGDPYCAPHFAGSYLAVLQEPCPKLKIAFSKQPALGIPLNDAMVKSVEQAAKLCEQLGHDVEEVTLEYDRERMGTIFQKIASSNLLAGIRRECNWRGIEKWPGDRLEAFTQLYCDYAYTINAAEYVDAIFDMHLEARKIAYFFTQYDMYLTPVLAQPPVSIGVCGPDSATTLQDYIMKQALFCPFTAVYNQTGQPAMSVPMAWHESLPIAVQFAAAFGREDLLLQLAYQLEQAQPWFKAFQHSGNA